MGRVTFNTPTSHDTLVTFSNDKPHGHGMLEYGNEYYIGDFENGMMHGDGLWKN